MTTPVSTMPVERELASSPFPSVARLGVSLALISLGCFSLHFPGFPSSGIVPLAFTGASWLLTPPAEWRRRLTAREVVLICVGMSACVALVVTMHGREFPAFGRFMQHPSFLVPLWILLCSGYIWRWRVLRHTSRTTSNPTGAV